MLIGMTRKTRDASKRDLRTLNAADLQTVTGGGGYRHGKPGEYSSSSGGGGGTTL